MLKRKLTKISNTLKNLFKSGRTKKYLLCKECGKIEIEVAQDISAVTCAYCVQRQVAPPPSAVVKEPGEKFPRGWALKATYIHTDGRVFEKGKDTGKTYTPGSADIPAPKVKKDVIKKVVGKKKVKKVAKTKPKKKRK